MRVPALRFIVAGAALAAAIAPISAARADAPSLTGSFSASASSDGVQVHVAVPNFLIVEDFVDGGGPSAQAALDSIGGSSGFASFPYPGETGVTALGLASILTGQSLPSYPFYASTSYPSTPDSTIDQPGYHLDVHSTATATTANAQTGETTTSGSQAGDVSTATTTQSADGTVDAHATTLSGLAAGAVNVSGANALADVTVDPDGTIHKTSSFTEGGLSAAGVDLGVSDQGLTVSALGTPVAARPLPQMSVTVGSTTVTYLPASSTDTSVLSAGLSIVTPVMVPATGMEVDTSFTLGRAAASVQSSSDDFGDGTNSSFPSTTSIDPTQPSPALTPSTAPSPVANPNRSVATAPVGVPTAVSSAAAPVSVVPSAAPLVTAAPPSLSNSAPSGDVAGQAAAGPQETVALERRALPGLPRLSFYPILCVVAGLIVAGSVAAHRRKAAS